MSGTLRDDGGFGEAAGGGATTGAARAATARDGRPAASPSRRRPRGSRRAPPCRRCFGEGGFAAAWRSATSRRFRSSRSRFAAAAAFAAARALARIARGASTFFPSA